MRLAKLICSPRLLAHSSSFESRRELRQKRYTTWPFHKRSNLKTFCNKERNCLYLTSQIIVIVRPFPFVSVLLAPTFHIISYYVSANWLILGCHPIVLCIDRPQNVLHFLDYIQTKKTTFLQAWHASIIIHSTYWSEKSIDFVLRGILIYLTNGFFCSLGTKSHHLNRACLIATTFFVQCGVLEPSGSVMQLLGLWQTVKMKKIKNKLTFDLLTKQK